MSDKQVLLTIIWNYDGPKKKAECVVTTHLGNAPDPPITHEEMQDITFAAKMEYARLMQRRKDNDLIRSDEDE